MSKINFIGGGQMYQPAMFREVNQAVLHELIRDFPFATVMVIHSDGVEISHLPLVLDTTKQKLIHWSKF